MKKVEVKICKTCPFLKHDEYLTPKGMMDICNYYEMAFNPFITQTYDRPDFCKVESILINERD